MRGERRQLSVNEQLTRVPPESHVALCAPGIPRQRAEHLATALSVFGDIASPGLPKVAELRLAFRDQPERESLRPMYTFRSTMMSRYYRVIPKQCDYISRFSHFSDGVY